MLILVLFRQNSAAAVWVEQISGNPAAILIVRQGNFIKAQEVMRLQPGDTIKILDKASAIRLMMGNGGLQTIDKAQSPFTLAGGQAKGSFLANLMGEVKKMLVASSDQTEAMAMMTRGRSKQLAIFSASPDDNLILASMWRLGLTWDGGKAPYRVSLRRAEEDKLLYDRKKIFGHKMTYGKNKNPEPALPIGEYQLLLESTGSKPATTQEVEILMVGKDELPEKAQKLLALKLDQRLAARLLINILYKHEEWRFFAHSLAIVHHFEKEQRALEVMR